MLTWNEMDFLTCLEILPVTDEYETCSTHIVKRDGIRLEPTVFQYGRDVYISIYRGESSHPLFDMKLLDCSGVRYVNDERGEYLEFAPAKCFGTRYDGESPIPYGVRVATRPDISVRLF